MKKKLSLKDLEVKDKKVLMRVDFNVPLDKKGHILDDTRIKAAIPSIEYVLKQGGSLILMSHLGRPKGVVNPELSLKPCAQRLSEILKIPVQMASDCIGQEVQNQADYLKPGQILLLENLRFHEGEEHPEKDPNFAKQLADLGDVYVNDAFGTAHRAHASTAIVAQYFKKCAAAGFLMEKEIAFLEQIITNPDRPFYAIVGGAKISSKIGTLKALLNKVDALFIGGGMAYTFFKVLGIPIGNSLYEEAFIEEAKQILISSEQQGKKIYLPFDNVIAKSIQENSAGQVVLTHDGIPDGFMGVDIGPKTIEKYSEVLINGKTIFWNGPMGVFENKNFASGTNAIAHLLAAVHGTTIVGGGESVAAVEAAGVADKISHISTGGGATLEYIEFGTLPGIEALTTTAT